ncbi:hypothetical protein ACFQJ5_07715 [Halomicroarcula sp. GCM10025324]|uniref:hypothetical protein n=1 Tax=Haloarcula TaxID=2237 RepID=UPI0023E75DE0|nr:hypothetical protein [Halomicroarcula sp. ZS-22-S1]
MSLVADNRLPLLFSGVVLTTVGAVGLGVVGVLATLSTLVTGGSILAPAVITVLGPLLLLGLDVVFAVALLRELRRRATLPKHQRLASVLRRLERVLPPLSALGLADRFEPPAPTSDERRAQIARRYVDGDLSEAELERELQALLESESTAADEPPVVESLEGVDEEREPMVERGQG